MEAKASQAPATLHREVDRINSPTLRSAGVQNHQARLLIDSGDTMATDPFLALAEDWMPRGAFDIHPHRGMETVTYVVDGAIEHRDNAGNRGTLLAGDAQWITAGSGIMHEENPPEGVLDHTLQLWVNLPAASKMTPARYQDLLRVAMPVRHEPGAEIRVFSGVSGPVRSNTVNHVPVSFLEVTLEAGARFAQDLPSTDNAFVVPIVGRVSVGAKQVSLTAGQLAWLTRTDVVGPSDILVTATDERARLLIISGRPLRESVVQRGPFVMNTEAQIRQAFADFRAERFSRGEFDRQERNQS